MIKYTIDPNSIKLEVDEKNDSVNMGMRQYLVVPVYKVKLTHVTTGLSVESDNYNSCLDNEILKMTRELEKSVYIHKLKNNYLNATKFGTKKVK